MQVTVIRQLARSGGATGIFLAGIYVAVRLLWAHRAARFVVLSLFAAKAATLLLLATKVDMSRNPSSIATPAYDIVDLGTEGLGVAVLALNNRGDTAGIILRDEQTAHAAIWRDGRPRSIGTLGGKISVATALNDSGEVVGFSQLDSTRYAAFLWSGRRMEELDGLKAFLSSATSINRRGRAAGFYYTMENGAFHPCIWADGMGTEIPLPEGSQEALVQDINDRNRAVGYTYCSVMEITEAVSWHEGQGRKLTTLGGVNSIAVTVNETGIIAGAANPRGSPVDEWNCVSWENGRIRDLGRLRGQKWGAAAGINRAGEIVGASGVG